ncbi:hypothetical protein EVU96_25280 [Bacillus infantis]|uniref:hypothetical protein n=1 Tax=Bacillus infantis TaxID=324767 RepID=UPI00101BC6C6|nr:hypothetical protein [Bacillus infantis]RYI24973.1 hypothetical protein EVU96_25280 [Bacillus infantis]
MPNNNGLYSLEEVMEIDLPIYDFTTENETGISMDLWTYTDIKKIFGWTLNDGLRKKMIRGFIKRHRMQGYAPLYSLKEVMYLHLGWSYNYNPSSED